MCLSKAEFRLGSAETMQNGRLPRVPHNSDNVDHEQGYTVRGKS